MNTNHWRTLLLVGGILALLVWPDAAWACPTCRDGLAQDAAHANLVRGYFWSICFMMSMPFVIFGAMFGYFYVSIRRARRVLRPAPVPSDRQLLALH